MVKSLHNPMNCFKSISSWYLSQSLDQNYTIQAYLWNCIAHKTSYFCIQLHWPISLGPIGKTPCFWKVSVKKCWRWHLVAFIFWVNERLRDNLCIMIVNFHYHGDFLNLSQGIRNLSCNSCVLFSPKPLLRKEDFNYFKD